MPIIETHQGPLFYAERGRGEPALWCLHGAGGTHQHWGPQLVSLHDAVRIVALDLPGHGRSPGRGCRSISAYSTMLLAALDKHKHEQVVLAGHSMGGAVALQTALDAPERVAGLVLISTGARLPVMPELLTHLEQGEFVQAVQTIIERAYGITSPPSLQVNGKAVFLQNNPSVLYGDLLACNSHDVSGRLQDIRCPTLIICGEQDRVTPLKFSHALHNGIPGSSLFVVPEAGHMVLLEQIEEVNMAIRQFLQLTSRCKSG